MKKLIALLLLLTLLVGCSQTPAEESTPTDPTEATPSVSEPASEPASEPVETPTLADIVPGFGNNSVTDRASYTIQNAEATDENMLTQIAVNANNESIFDNKQLQIAFWTEYQNFLSSYGQYLAYIGLDASKPLSEQNYAEGKTWEQYFLENALMGLERNYALSRLAYDNGYVLSEEDTAVIEDILLPDGDFASEYKELGFADADSYIQSYFGKGTDAAAYQEYNRMYFAAADCYYQEVEKLEAALTEEDVIAYYDAHAEEFAQSGLKKCNNINIRHILIQPEGEESTWTEESWKAAEAATQAIYEQWQQTPTEEAFAALATEKTQDPGSAESGGLYEDVAPGDMVTEFNDWCFDPSRQVGDHGIVKTSYGYHIMYFVGEAESRKWFDTAKEQYLSEQMSQFVEQTVAAYPVSFDHSLMFIYDLITEKVEAPAG